MQSSLNKKIGYLYKIQESNFRLNKPLDINEFLKNSTKNYLLIKSKHTFFSSISIFQFFKASLAHDEDIQNLNFIFSDLKQFYICKKEIIESIETADKKSILIIEINEELSENFIPHLKKSKFILISDSKRFTQLVRYFEKTKAKIKYQYDKEYKYDDLTDESKLNLIESEVFFQKKLIKFKDLLGIEKINQLSEDSSPFIDLDIFTNLKKISYCDEKDDENIYIERSLFRNAVITHENYFYNLNEINEQVIVISEEAGMGKSTFLVNLSRNLKYSTDDSFVVKVDLNKFFTELKNYRAKSESDKNLKLKQYRSIEFLSGLNIFRTDLEKYLVKNFSNNQITFKFISRGFGCVFFDLIYYNYLKLKAYLFELHNFICFFKHIK